MSSEERSSSFPTYALLVTLLILLGTWLRVRDVTLPYDRHFEGFSGGAFANSAELHLEHGIAELGFFPIFNRPLPEERASWHFYTNHPATIPLIHLGVTSLLGVNEWSLRLPHVLGSLAILILTFLLARSIFDRWTASIALAIATFLPGLVAYSTLPNYENLTLPVMLLMIGLHERAVRTGSRASWFGFVVLTFVGTSLDWPAALLVPGLAFARLFVEPTWRSRILAAARTGLVGTAGILPAVLLHQFLVHRTIEITSLPREQVVTQSLSERAGTILDPLLRFDLGPWFAGQIAHAQALIGLAILLPAAFGLLLALTPFTSAKQKLILLPGFATGFAYLLLFARHSVDQDLFWIYTLPFVALGFALPFAFFVRRFPRTSPWILTPLVLATCALAYRDTNVLRDAWRGELETAAIGNAIDARLPADVSLYVPAEAGWGAAYNYYARRPIHQLTQRGAGTDANALTVCVPEAAYRALDIPRDALKALDEHLIFLARSGLLNHRTGLILPLDPRHAQLEPLWEQAKSALARITRYETIALDGLGEVLLFPRTDWSREGPVLAVLRQDEERSRGVRAFLEDRARLAGDARNVYLPIPNFAGHGPLVLGSRWFWNVQPHTIAELFPGHVEPTPSERDEAAGRTHELDLAFRSTRGFKDCILLWPETASDELARLLPLERIAKPKDVLEGWLRLRWTVK